MQCKIMTENGSLLTDDKGTPGHGDMDGTSVMGSSPEDHVYTEVFDEDPIVYLVPNRDATQKIGHNENDGAGYELLDRHWIT